VISAGAQLLRSYLYVPGDSGDRLARASSRGADAVIVDLEDAVTPARKDMALTDTMAWLHEGPSSAERWVRINSGERGLEEVAQLLGPGLTGICMPKVGGAEEVERVSALLDSFEQRSSPGFPSISLMPLIESAAGVQALLEIAAARRVHRLQLGELDLAADLGLHIGDDEVELLPVRSAVVVASRAAGLLPPVGAVSPEIRNTALLAATTRRLRLSGFVGRAAIHPAQLATIHQAFAGSPDETAAAKKLLAQFESAQRRGSVALVGDDGRMVDEAVIRRCRQVIALAEAAEEGLER